MKVTLTALSLILVLGNVSAVQAAVSPAVSQHRAIATDVPATRNIATATPAAPALAPHENLNHMVYTHLGAVPVDSDLVDLGHPEGTKR